MSREILFVIVGQRIKELRQKRRMTQQDLSKVCNVSRTTIVNMESANQRIGLLQMAKILLALEATWMDILPEPNEKLFTSAKDNLWKQAVERAYKELTEEEEHLISNQSRH